MYIRNQYFFFFYKAVFIILCLWGLYLNSGLPQGEIRWGVFNYYTIQSNILCLLYFICSFSWNLTSIQVKNQVETFMPRFKGAVIFAITVTGLIYHFILRPSLFSMGYDTQVYSTANLLVHYIVPLMTIFDWLLFDPKGAFKKFDPFLWLLIPYAYFIYTILRAQSGGTILATGSRYPYGFINIDALGWEKVLTNVGILTIVFLLIGYVYYFVDRGVARYASGKLREYKESGVNEISIHG